MRKNDAINAIVRAARLYEEKLHKKKLLIVFGSPNKPKFIEVRFPAGGFVHLTGVELNKVRLAQTHPNKKVNLNELFYEKAIQGKISPDDFGFKSDGTTELKLSVITQAIDVIHNAKMIGDFKGHHCKLDTDKLAGSIHSSLGLVLTGKYYVPNTILATDTRNEVLQPQKVLAILSKEDGLAYTNIERVAKKIDIERLLQQIHKLLPIDSSLIPSLIKMEEKTSTQSTNIMQFQPKPLPRTDVLTAMNNLPQKDFLTRLRDFARKITAKIRQAFSSSKQQQSTSIQRPPSAPNSQRNAAHDKSNHADQNGNHDALQRKAAQKPHTLSRAKRTEIAAQSQRAGHADKPQQSNEKAHSHDDDILS